MLWDGMRVVQGSDLMCGRIRGNDLNNSKISTSAVLSNEAGLGIINQDLKDPYQYTYLSVIYNKRS